MPDNHRPENELPTTPSDSQASGEAGAGGGAGESGQGGAGGQSGGSAGNAGSSGGGSTGGGRASYCPPVIDVNCDPACGPTHPACTTGYCTEEAFFDISAQKPQYVIQLPTDPKNECCTNKHRYILHLSLTPSSLSTNYRTTMVGGSGGWSWSGTAASN